MRGQAEKMPEVEGIGSKLNRRAIANKCGADWQTNYSVGHFRIWPERTRCLAMSKSDPLAEARQRDLEEMEQLLGSAPIRTDLQSTKERHKLSPRQRNEFTPAVRLASSPPSSVSATPPSNKAAQPAVSNSSSPPSQTSPRGTRLDLGRSPAKASASVAPSAPVQRAAISAHREEFLAPGSVEYGLGSGEQTRWLTPEDLELEFGAKEAARMIDDYDMDAVNNTKRALERAAHVTAAPSRTTSAAPVKATAAASPPPPVPKRSTRTVERAAPAAAAASPASPRSGAAPNSASSPRDTSASSPRAASPRDDGVASAKEKLATLKSLFEDGLIDQKEYDVRKKAILDEMLK